MQLIPLLYFLSWVIISVYLEFIFIVPHPFYGPINHFYFWNIKWKFDFMYSNTVLSPNFYFAHAEGYFYKRTAGLQKHYIIINWQSGAGLRWLVSNIQVLLKYLSLPPSLPPSLPSWKWWLKASQIKKHGNSISEYLPIKLWDFNNYISLNFNILVPVYHVNILR